MWFFLMLFCCYFKEWDTVFSSSLNSQNNYSSIGYSTSVDDLMMQLSLKLNYQPTGGAQSPSCLLFLFTVIAVQENQQVLEMSQAECRETLHKLLPNVPLPDEQVCLFFSAFCILGTFFKVRLVFVLLSPPRCSRTIRNGSWDLRGQ